jgi:hypothetical protein
MTLRIMSAGVLLVLFAGSSSALAEAPAEPHKAPKKDESKPSAYAVEVMVLHATNTEKGIDPRIGQMPELSKPPFSSYKSYTLLEKLKQPLEKGKPKTQVLPNDRVLRTELLEELPEGRVKLSASINKPGGETFLPLLEVKAQIGQSFIVAGQAYKGGILVLVIRVVR